MFYNLILHSKWHWIRYDIDLLVHASRLHVHDNPGIAIYMTAFRNNETIMAWYSLACVKNNANLTYEKSWDIHTGICRLKYFRCISLYRSCKSEACTFHTLLAMVSICYLITNTLNILWKQTVLSRQHTKQVNLKTWKWSCLTRRLRPWTDIHLSCWEIALLSLVHRIQSLPNRAPDRVLSSRQRWRASSETDMWSR